MGGKYNPDSQKEIYIKKKKNLRNSYFSHSRTIENMCLNWENVPF